MARKSDAKLKSDVGGSLEARISALVGTGFTNDHIFDLISSAERTECVPLDHPSRKTKAGKAFLAFDKIASQRLREQVRSVRGLMKIDAENDEAWFEATGGGGEMMGIDEIPLENIKRFSCGMPGFDYLYGESHYIHVSGPDRGKPTGYIEHGMPESFLSIWPGEPGVGKSRTAIELCKSINKSRNRRILYYNGEATPSQFRSWCGTDVNNDLFKVRNSEMFSIEQIVQDSYTFQPCAIVFDSVQHLMGWLNGSKSVARLLSRLKYLKTEKAAGNPHIILISQLNKKKELKGSMDIPHLVDFVAKITKVMGRKDHFFFECPIKNRGGASGRGIEFKHTNAGVECVSTNYAAGPIFKLKQVSGNEPAAVPANPTVDQGAESEVEAGTED